MFQQELWTSLKQIKEIETSVKKDIKKNQIEVLELKTTLEIKRSVSGQSKHGVSSLIEYN